MGFLDETSNVLGINNKLQLKTFCYVSPEHGIVIEGYKKIYELSKTKITLLCEQSKKIEVIGVDLSIKEIANKEISIRGQITQINFV